MRTLEASRVLIVEDEVLLAMGLEQVLIDAGCREVATASTVTEARQKVAGWQPDAVILDLNLFGEKSFPVADTLSEMGIPFVILSGHSQGIVPERHAARPFLVKPCDPSDLVRALHGLVNAAERHST